jgi:hypothetical protein
MASRENPPAFVFPRATSIVKGTHFEDVAQMDVALDDDEPPVYAAEANEAAVVKRVNAFKKLEGAIMGKICVTSVRSATGRGQTM